MAGELTQKKIENLGEVTEPVDADVFLHGSGGGNVIKKISWGNLVKKLRSLLFVNNTTTTEEGYGADARVVAQQQKKIDEVSTSLSKLRSSVNRHHYQILSVQGVSLTTSTAIDSGARTTLSETFSAVSGATHYYPFLRGSNWLTPGSASISGNTIKCEFINQTGGKHSGGGYFYVVALKEVSEI